MGSDLLSQAITVVRADLRHHLPLHERLRSFWAGAAAALDLAAFDQIESDFLDLAQESGLATNLGTHAVADLQHVIDWALRGRDPFGGAA